MQREARPISLRQLTFFGRTLTENRLLSSANYVRTELPTRYVIADGPSRSTWALTRRKTRPPPAGHADPTLRRRHQPAYVSRL